MQNGVLCAALHPPPRSPVPGDGPRQSARREGRKEGQIQQHMPRRTVRRRGTRTQSAISNSQREALVWSQARPRDAPTRGRPRGFEPRPGRRTHTMIQNETGPTAQRHMALAGPPTPTIQGHGGYLGTTDDDRRGRPPQSEEGAPARVLALEATHTQTAFRGRGAWARGTYLPGPRTDHHKGM